MRKIKAIATPNLHVLKLVTDWMKKEGIKCCCAPFEAEQKCVRLEQAGIVDAVMSKDCDCATLGVGTLHCSTNFYNQTFKVHNKDNKTKDNEESPLFQHDANRWLTIGAMLGCDCVRNVHNMGFSTLFKKLFPFLVSQEIDEIDDVLQKNTKHKMSIELKMRLSASIALLTCAPVLDEDLSQHL